MRRCVLTTRKGARLGAGECACAEEEEDMAVGRWTLCDCVRRRSSPKSTTGCGARTVPPADTRHGTEWDQTPQVASGRRSRSHRALAQLLPSAAEQVCAAAGSYVVASRIGLLHHGCRASQDHLLHVAEWTHGAYQPADAGIIPTRTVVNRGRQAVSSRGLSCSPASYIPAWRPLTPHNSGAPHTPEYLSS